MRTRIRKWADGAIVRIPTPMLRAARITPGEIVNIREEAGRIVIASLWRKFFDVNDLVKAINPKNRHKPSDFGAAVGKEVW